MIFLEDLGLFQLCIFYVAKENKEGVHANLNSLAAKPQFK